MKPVYLESWGAVSSFGDWPQTWAGLLSGERAATSCSQAGLEMDVPTPIGAVEALDRSFRSGERMEGPALRLCARACAEALGMRSRRGVRVYGGSTHGEADALLGLVRGELSGAEREARWAAVLADPVPPLLTASLGAEVELGGWAYSACTSGAHAIVDAVLHLPEWAEGALPTRALVTGVDTLSTLAAIGFWRSGASSENGCQPFQADADGTMVSEGAAAILLSAAPPEQGVPLALLGVGMACDAGHPTHPDPAGQGLEDAIRNALAAAGVSAASVGAVVAHGTGTPVNDAIEAAVITRVFGERGVPVTSVKGAIGHTFGAAPLFNLLVAAQGLLDGRVPPVTRTRASAHPTLDLVTEAPRSLARIPVLTLSSGFGGNHVALLAGPG